MQKGKSHDIWFGHNLRVFTLIKMEASFQTINETSQHCEAYFDMIALLHLYGSFINIQLLLLLSCCLSIYEELGPFQ